MELTHTSSGSSIGADKVADITVPANDNPHGTVYFRQTVYRVQEPIEGNAMENITLRRRYVESKLSPAFKKHLVYKN